MSGNPQEKFPAGCYMSFEELKEHKPSVASRIKIYHEFTVYKDSDTFSLGYQLVPLKNSIVSRSDLKKSVFAYSNDTDLYINCRLVGLKPNVDNFSNEYVKVITNGRFLCFFYNERQEYNEIYAPAVLALFITVAQVIDAATAKRKGDYIIYEPFFVIDMEQAKRYRVDSAYLEKVLVDYPEIQDKFKSEPYKNDIVTQLSYFNRMNEEKKQINYR